MNYTNPGAISHNEILELYKEYIDPEFTWENFTLEEQAKVIVAPRSNNLLDTTRMKSEFPELLGIKESLIKYVFEPNAPNKEEVKKAVDAMRNEYRAA
jgi:3,5-epimerase/4-reductase